MKKIIMLGAMLGAMTLNANEQMGNLRQAKKDYRKGKKYGCYQASSALESLKAKKRRK